MGACSLHFHSLPCIAKFESNCRMQWILIDFQTEKSSFWILEYDHFLFENPWISIPSWIMATILKNSNLNGIKKKFKENRNRKTMQIQKISWIFCRTFSLNLHICLVLIYLHQIAGCDGYMWISKLIIFNLAVFQT